MDEGEQGQRGRGTIEPSMQVEHGTPETGACALGMAPALSEQLLEPANQEPPQGSAGLSQNARTHCTGSKDHPEGRRLGRTCYRLRPRLYRRGEQGLRAPGYWVSCGLSSLETEGRAVSEVPYALNSQRGSLERRTDR